MLADSVEQVSSTPDKKEVSKNHNDSCDQNTKTENCSVKKRTISDRSPMVKSRKKTPVQGTPISNSTTSPSAFQYDSNCENKENRTPGPTPYWKVID